MLTEHGITIAPSTYYDAVKAARRVSAAELSEERLTLAIARVHLSAYALTCRSAYDLTCRSIGVLRSLSF